MEDLDAMFRELHANHEQLMQDLAAIPPFDCAAFLASLNVEPDPPETVSSMPRTEEEWDESIFDSLRALLADYERKHGTVSPLPVGIELRDNAPRKQSMRFFKRELIEFDRQRAERDRQ